MHTKIIHKAIRFVKKKKRRYLNQKHISDYPAQSGGWMKYDGNPVIGGEDLGTVFDPFVRRMDNNYIMCLSRRVDNSLMFFSSDDGVVWHSGRVVLNGISGSRWESAVNRGCFLMKDGIWYLWYTGQSNGKSCIGLAVSKDGVSFERIEDNPVLVAENHYEGVSVMNPCVIWDEDENVFKMWYAAGEDYEPDVLCYAQSCDGIHWAKYNRPIMTADPDLLYKSYKVGACDVIKWADRYYMVYIAYQNLDVARIAMAESPDGVNGWTECGEMPILGPEKNAWDRHAVYKPTMCLDATGENMMLWYNGRDKKRERIGMAKHPIRKESAEWKNY